MKHPSTAALISIVSVLVATSCKEDPKLVAKREQQKTEIVRLTGELALLEEKLESLPEDVSPQLAKAEDLLKEQTEELAELEAETAELAAKRDALQKEFDAYRAKYPAK